MDIFQEVKEEYDSWKTDDNDKVNIDTLLVHAMRYATEPKRTSKITAAALLIKLAELLDG